MTATDTTVAAPTILDVKAETLRTALRSLIPMTSKDATLPIIGSIQLAVQYGGIELAATDRYVLGTYSITGDRDVVDWDCEAHAPTFNLSVADAKMLVAAIGTRPKGTVRLTFTPEGDYYALTADYYGPTLTLRSVGGEFPAVRRLIPDGDATLDQPVGLAPDRLADIVAAGKALGKGDVPITFTFDGPVKPVRLTSAADDRWIGLIMPVRVI